MGMQEVTLFEASGLHPPRQKLPVPQNPYSLQQGASDEHGLAEEHAVP
jgi:hypothetical protein